MLLLVEASWGKGHFCDFCSLMYFWVWHGAVLAMCLMNEWMKSFFRNLALVWRETCSVSCPSAPVFPVACLELSWKMIFHTCHPYYNIIPQSEALWPPRRPVFNVMKGDLMELRRTKQKAGRHFRQAEQAVPLSGRKRKEKGGKSTPSLQKTLD